MTRYLDRVQQILISAPPRRRVSPATLLNIWSLFVASVERGFEGDWDDFDNDRSVRATIDKLLADQELRSMPEWLTWSNQVYPVDDRYRAVLVPLPGATQLAWWDAGVPGFAGHQLVSDVRRMYGLDIRAVSR